MKEIVSEVKYTSILSLVLLISVFMIWVGVPSISHSITKEKLSEVTESEIKDKVTNKINYLKDFRKANINNETITNVEMLSFIFMNLNDKDYDVKKMAPLNMVCQYTDGIGFTSNSTCSVILINVKKLDEYKNLLFKYDKELEYVDFQYNGLDCKTNGSYYYCLMNDYKTDTYREFNVIDGIYKTDDLIVVYEYYLSFKFDHDSCIKYYNEEVCEESYDGEFPIIEDEVIKENGVYYRHEFVMEDDEPYLKQSFIYNN